MIRRISVTKYRDAQNKSRTIQFSALQTNTMSIFISNKKGSFEKKQWYCKPDFSRQYFMHIVKSLVCKYLSKMTDSNYIFKTHVEICQFTEIAWTDLDV